MSEETVKYVNELPEIVKPKIDVVFKKLFGDPVLQWLRLINAETEEELRMMEQSDIKEIRDAVTVVRTFSADEQMRINAFEREMAIYDHLAEISAAKRDGELEAEKKYKSIVDDAEKRADAEKERADKAESERDALAARLKEAERQLAGKVNGEL